MTAYDVADRQEYGANPVELFSFVGSSKFYTTTAQEDIVYAGVTYKSGFVDHDGIQATEELAKQSLRIRLRNDADIIQDFIAGVPIVNIVVSVFRYIYGVNEFRLLWSGRVVSVVFGADGISEIACESIYTSLQRTGLRAHYQRICRHNLYGLGCGANREAYTFEDSVKTVSGAAVTTAQSARTDGAYICGMLRFGVAYRLIVDHSGGKFILSGPLKDLKAGSAVSVTYGCQHTMADCKNRFNNTLNFGGFPYLPDRNLFSGDRIA